MSDYRFRQLERAWKSTGAEVDELAYLEEKARHDLLGGRIMWAQSRGGNAKLYHAWKPTVFDLKIRIVHKTNQHGFVSREVWKDYPGGLPVCGKTTKRFHSDLGHFILVWRNILKPDPTRYCQTCRKWMSGPRADWPDHLKADHVRLAMLRFNATEVLV